MTEKFDIDAVQGEIERILAQPGVFADDQVEASMASIQHLVGDVLTAKEKLEMFRERWCGDPPEPEPELHPAVAKVEGNVSYLRFGHVGG